MFFTASWAALKDIYPVLDDQFKGLKRTGVKRVCPSFNEKSLEITLPNIVPLKINCFEINQIYF